MTVDEIVIEMASDIDLAIGSGHVLPFSGDDLRQHYADLLQRHPAEQVLDDCRRRYAAQVLTHLLPLQFPVDLRDHAFQQVTSGGAT